MSEVFATCGICAANQFVTSIFKTKICIVKDCESRKALYSVYEDLYKNFVDELTKNEDFEIFLKNFQDIKFSISRTLIDLPPNSRVDLFLELFNIYEKILKHVLENSERPLYVKLNNKIVWKESILKFTKTISKLNASSDEEKVNLLKIFIGIESQQRVNRERRSRTLNIEPSATSEELIIEQKTDQQPDFISLEKVDAIYIFDFDNTLRYEIDNSLIVNNIRYLDNILNDPKKNNLVYIASCNSSRNVNEWVEQNGYKGKVFVHAAICSKGYKDLTSVVETFDDLNIDENVNKFVIGDTFKDMDSIRIIKQKITGKKAQNWYFLRSYIRSYKLVEQYLKNNPDLFLLPNGTRHIYPQTDAVFPFDAEEKFYNYNCGDLYFLPDGVLLPNLLEVGFLSTDYHNFKNIDFFQNSKELYIIAKYGDHNEHSRDIDTIENKFKNSFKVAILGRYFRASLHNRSNPASVSAVEILDFKKGNPLSNNLKLSLDNFFNEQIKNFPNIEKGNIIITSVPNSDGSYRFNKYLLELKNKIKDIDTELEIFILDDFIRQVGERGQNHNLQGVDNRMNNVKGKYAINEKYLSNQEYLGAHVFVIDDVLTSGSTFNEINETLYPYGFNFLGVVLGKHQSYPYTESMGLVSYNYLPFNESAFKEIISEAWYDMDFRVSP